MSRIDSRNVLWANVSAFMRARWGRENLRRLASEAGVGVTTIYRIKQQDTSIGLEVVDSIAAAFQLEAWQLLVPCVDPNHPPTLLPMSEAERKFYERVANAARDLRDTEK